MAIELLLSMIKEFVAVHWFKHSCWLNKAALKTLKKKEYHEVFKSKSNPDWIITADIIHDNKITQHK